MGQRRSQIPFYRKRRRVERQLVKRKASKEDMHGNKENSLNHTILERCLEPLSNSPGSLFDKVVARTGYYAAVLTRSLEGGSLGRC